MKILFLTLILSAVLILNGCGSDTVTQPPPAATPPTLTSPADNATGVPLTPTFKWSGEADKLQVSTNSGFTSLTIDATVSGTEYTPPNSLASGVYFWRAGKTSGGTVYWSTVFRFTTM